MKSTWPSSPTLDAIWLRQEELKAQAATLPERISIARLARFLGCSKSPIQLWIRAKLIAAPGKGRRRQIPRADVFRIIEASLMATSYQPKRPKPFHKLRRLRRKVQLPPGSPFTIKQVMVLFNCSRTTVMRAVDSGDLRLSSRSSYRWVVTRKALLESPVFRPCIREEPKRVGSRSIRLPKMELFTTADVAFYCRVSQQTVRNLIKAKELEGVRIGTRKLFVRRESLRTFLVRHSDPGKVSAK